MAQERPSRDDVRRQMAEQAARDPQFRQQLMENPREAVRQHMGMDIPGDLEITVLEETPAQFYVILPAPLPSSQTLSDSDLERVAGGFQITAPETMSNCN